MLQLHGAATPLQITPDDWGEFAYAENDESYREYVRLLRSYDRMAWQYHECNYCREGICPGEWYEGCVWLECKNGKTRVWVEKRHYPECPEREREIREEMERDRENEQASIREAA